MKYKLVEITNLPSDPMGSMGRLRTELLRVYNNSRTNFKEHRMKILENTLRCVLIAIEEGKSKQLRLPDLTEEKQKELETLIDLPKEEPKTKRNNAKRNKQENK